MDFKHKVPVNRERVKASLRQHRATIKKMCEDCNMNYGTVGYCLGHGEIMPDYLALIADYTRTNTEYLKGN